MIIFFSGNRNIIHISAEVQELIEQVLEQYEEDGEPSVIIGDADGADDLIQSMLDPELHTTVYYSGYKPRYTNRNTTAVRKITAYGTGKSWHQFKDREMAKDCDIHIGLVDTSLRSWTHSGTVNNHQNVLSLGKPSHLICVSAKVEVTNWLHNPK